MSTSLFGVWYFGRAGFPVDDTFEALTRPKIRRIFYSIAFAVSLAQFIVGPLVLFTLPSAGFRTAVVVTILLGAAVAAPAVWMMWRELSAAEPDGKRLPRIVAYLAVTVLCMAFGRHLYRGVALADHRAAMQAATQLWVDESAQAAYDVHSKGERAAAGISDGQHLFQTNCAACHGLDTKVVGPPLTEIAQIYAGNPGGIGTWARAPGKKRDDAPQMPPFAGLGDDRLGQVAQYMLEAGAR